MNEEVTNTEGQIETPQKTGRALFEDNIRAKYGNDIGEDEMYNRLMSDYDTEHEFAKGAREDRKQLSESMSADPDFAQFVRDVIEGGDVSGSAMALAGNADESMSAERNAMIAEHGRRRGEVLNEMEQMYKNSDDSAVAIRKYVEEHGLSQEETEELMAFATQNINDVMEGKITPEFLELLDKGRKYDEDIKVANEAGRVAGRNDNIDAQRKRYDHSQDGLPVSRNDNSFANEGKKGVKSDDFFANLASKQYNNPWEK